MDEEDSLIKILHYRNPHLMWVELKIHDTYTLRQVGLFGVVPRQASLVDGERVCSKSDTWDPRIDDIVEEFFESKNLYFKSTYRLEDDNSPTSIFTDQPHIFGEISFRKQDGTKKQLANCLDSSVYAIKSKKEFWQMLDEGKIKTKHHDAEEFSILQKIIDCYQVKGIWHKRQQILYKHLSPAQVTKLEDSTPKLTVENLEKHRKLTGRLNKGIGIEAARSKKYHDYNCNNEVLAPIQFIENAIKKFTINENSPCNEAVLDVSMSHKAKRANNQTHTRNIPKHQSKDKELEKFEEPMKHKEKFRQPVRNLISESDCSQKSTESFNKDAKSNKTPPKNASPSGRVEERLVAYGPPLNHPQTLVVKKLVRKIDNPPTEAVEDKKCLWNGGKIIWDDDCEATNFNKSDEIISNAANFGGPIEVSRNIAKNNKFEGNSSNLDNDNESDQISVDLNDAKHYNVFVQNKQGNKEIKMQNDQYDNVSVKQNNKSDIIVSSENDIKENKSSAQKSRSKLLDIMRKRKAILNSSVSSDDNSTTKDKDLHLNDISTDDSSNQKHNTSAKSYYDSDEEINIIHAKLNSKPLIIKAQPKINVTKESVSVNPYKNLDGSKSVFVDNLIQPVLLAHTKNNNKILPQNNLRDIPFKREIHNTLRNKLVKNPTRLQSISWPYILRGHSMVIIGAVDSGKTLGYIPAVCNLVLDYNFEFAGLGPICVIVCATALSVSNVAAECRMFVNHQRVVACYAGIDNLKLVTDLTNGCDILVSTPSQLYRLLSAELGVDLRRLTTLVYEDCERLDLVYEFEVKAIQLYVKQMLKSRTDKQVKVQYVLASRKWCEFMTPLAKKMPDTIVAFSAFHECVLYSKANTSVSFVKKDKKIDAVVDFLKETDESKLTVVVCRSDDEVDALESTLRSKEIAVVACNNKMTIHDLYKMRSEVFSSVLICCDGNLNHLNVNNANYLVHFSMPAVYSQFCRRFSVLNEKFPSIFGPAKEIVKIKILLEENNVEELPKILNFVKRCSSQVPEVLNEVAQKVLEQKEVVKAGKLVPICNCLMALGECEDFYICQERHALLKGYDDPKSWMPCNGVITFKIIHYKTAVSYSARLLTHTSGENKIKYPETYGTLCMKLGMFFSKDENKRLHGEPKVGDLCAVAIRKNFIARCKVLKIRDYEKGQAKSVVVNLIDDEEIRIISAVELYYLPEEFKTVETYVVNVRLAGIKPEDKDVTFSELAMNELKKLTNEDVYLKGGIAITVGNTVFVNSLEACVDLTALCEKVVKHDFKKLLLASHAVPNPEHLSKLQKLCDVGNLNIRHEPEVKTKTKSCAVKKETDYRWAHLDKNDWTDVIFSNTINAFKFFVRPQKFSKCINSLISDIQKYVADNPGKVDNVCVKDVVLAEFPDDSVYERAIIDEIIDESKVKCFFVDNADWREVTVNKLKPIPQKFIKQIPFQSIECRLIGVKPPGEEWTEFSTNWLHDNCLEDDKGNSKRMYVKYFTKEKAELTGGHKYGVILVDTTTVNDVVINKRMIELNLAAENNEEIEYLEKPLDYLREKTDTSSFEDDFDELDVDVKESILNDESCRKELIPTPNKVIPNQDLEAEWETNYDIEENDETNNKITSYTPKSNCPIDDVPKIPLKNIFAEKPIKSFPLVSDSDEDFDKWDVCMDENLGKCFGLPNLSQSYNNSKNKDQTKQDDDYDKLFVGTGKQQNVVSTPVKAKLPAIVSVRNEKELIVTDDEQTCKGVDDVGKRQINKKTKPGVTNTNTTLLPDVNDNMKIINDENIKLNNDAYKTNQKLKNIPIKANKKAFSKLKIDEIEPNDNLDIRDNIKNESYDSDDTTSTNDRAEISFKESTKELIVKEEPLILDSDDTQSIVIENEKELCVEQKELNKSLDSDDFEIIDASLTAGIVEVGEMTNNIPGKDKACEIKKYIELSIDTSQNLAGKIKVGKPITEYKAKIIPITEITKSEIGMNTNAQNYQLSKPAEINKDENVNTRIDKNVKQNKESNILKDANKSKIKSVTVIGTVEAVRTPQLVWRQDKNTITVKIKVIVDEYTLETGTRSLKFSAYQNEVKYAFDIELYGVIESEKTVHSNKGQYILVTLVTLVKKTTKWLKLTKSFNSWIVYDVDSIDTSSDEETPVNDDAMKIIMDNHEKAMEFGDDDDIDDTSGYNYDDKY